MPDLPKISQEFDADAGGFISALQAMIDMTERLAEAIDRDIAKIAELKAAIDSLPDTKVVNVIYKLTTEGGAPDITSVENIVVKGTGPLDAATEALARMQQQAADTAASIARDGQAMADLVDKARAATAADNNLAAAAGNAARATTVQAREASRLAEAVYAAQLELQDIEKAERSLADVSGVTREQLAQEEEAFYRLEVAAHGATDVWPVEAAGMEKTAVSADALKAAILGAGSELYDIVRAQHAAADAADISAQQLREEEQVFRAVERAAADTTGFHENIAAQEQLAAVTREYRAVIGSMHSDLADMDFNMVRMAKEAVATAGGVGKMAISLGGAAFGAGGAAVAFGLTAGAIHLIIMGTFEFLAVFIPAMYAAAAAAAVLYQGIGERVVPKVQSLYTASEALGGMLNTTAGDALGLGHSLQTAQNMANPMAYTLFGEALLALRAAMGPTTNGLSAFGIAGLAVSRILEQFGAKIVVDLRTNMDQFRSLLGQSVVDLVEFGQILGNIGHALLNFAAAMPGAAELVLKVVDAISMFIKWLSQLPPWLLYTVFLIEELYRWSNVLVGVFGLLGRGIALLGTLGIPVFLKIGSNFAMMAANIISGVGGMIINFVAGGERIGIFGARVDAAATKMVGALGSAASFMSGPWGIAIGLGAVAIAGLVVWMSHWHSAVEQFVIDANKAVSAATNLQALNVVANEMVQTVGKLAAANTQLAVATQQAATQQGNVASRYTGMNQSVDEAAGAVAALTAEQQKLFQQGVSVITGAQTISKAYGISFTGALGLADAAGVKLANTQVILGKNANQAGIQIEGLVLGYQKMDLTGGILANSMNAVSIQANIQSTQVSKVNQAWDQFIAMSTSLTGSFAQFNLDLQQMGNNAQTVGAKITAFSGTTQLSVNQIALALRSFSGSSAQVWQAFNQSVQQANTFMDALRTAAAAGVVPQQQFTQAIASVVGQLLPYAAHSKAALAELFALASEAGGPASGSFKTLSDWVDRNKVSASKFGDMIDTLTAKISNVSAVAKQFAGTMQNDVLNAIANAAVGTANITGLTQNYTTALENNLPGSAAVKNAQDAFNAALRKLGFTHQDVIQLDQELTTAYGKNSAAAGAAGGATGLLAGAMDVARKNHMDPFRGEIKDITNWYWQMQGALANWPTKESTVVTFTGSGGANITSTVAGVPGGKVSVTGLPTGSRFAGGGVLPGYSPGHDSVLAMLSPGEGILTPQAVRMLGAGTVDHINHSAKHFAEGGVVFPNVAGWGREYLSTATKDSALAFAKILGTSLQSVVTSTQQMVTQMGTSVPGHPSGNISAWMRQAMALTGVPSSWLNDLLTIAFYESNFNPNAINLWDSNAKAGDPSRGLMQTIMSTFVAYHQPGTAWNIYDPVANIAAAIRYIEARYGSVFNVPGIISLGRGQGYTGYDSGGYLMPGLTLAYNGTGVPERVSPPGGGEAHVIHNVVNLDGRVIWDNQQEYTLRYGLRNSGQPKGVWSPL